MQSTSDITRIKTELAKARDELDRLASAFRVVFVQVEILTAQLKGAENEQKR